MLKYCTRLFGSFVVMAFALVACAPDTSQDSNSIASSSAGSTSFTLMPASQTGINFQNILREGPNTNILVYEYFYNGGGVAISDLNGDQLEDIYFTSNMGDNKLYLNEGEMQFRDITDLSKAAGRSGPWKTGVSMADVNGDGKMDVYLCYSGALPAEKRKNQLLINQGNNTDGIPIFQDQAEQYGLASSAFSNQGYFLDYDRDGDLDMLLLNHNPKSLPILNEAQTKAALAIDDQEKGLRLYQQANGKFTDVTLSAGISGSELSYGLGLGISDIDQDGWPDFYVSNDYMIPDYLYMNNGDGTFRNDIQNRMGHTSQFSMGNDIADINNDGLQDIYTLDMLPEDNHRQKLLVGADNYTKFDLNVRSGFYYQYMRNMLQLNNGDGSFSEVGQMVGVSNTDWSWAALLADYNNDGWKDLYVTNGYTKDYTNKDFINYMDGVVAEKGRLQRADVQEIIRQMPASDVTNYMFQNERGVAFSNQTSSWALDQKANSNGAAYADLDNDGDLDLVVNNVNKEAFIYKNNTTSSDGNFLQIELIGEGKNPNGVGSRLNIWAGGEQQQLEAYPARGYLSSVSPVLHFGLGKASSIDSLEVHWPNGKSQIVKELGINQRLALKQSEARLIPNRAKIKQAIFRKIKSPIDLVHPSLAYRDFDRQPLLVREYSNQGPVMMEGDITGDGLIDIVIGGAMGKSAKVYSQNEKGQFEEIVQSGFQLDKGSEDAAISILDCNGDGHMDLYIGSGGYHQFKIDDPMLNDRLYINDGRGRFSKSKNGLPIRKLATGALAVHDIDGDGDQDVFIGGTVQPGRYPESSESAILINDGQGIFVNQITEIAPDLQQLGAITDAQWVDLDGDAQMELVVVGEWLPVSIYNFQNGKLENRTMDYLDQQESGWWNSIAFEDVNGDGKLDFIVGNFGTNSQLTASKEAPVELYYDDYDSNGSIDPILCSYIQGVSYPFVTKDELGSQLSSMRSRFTSYQSYADIQIKDLLTNEQLESSKVLAVDQLETKLFLSAADGTYQSASLPVEVQYAPIHAIHFMDYNNDGNQDVILAGNQHRMKLRLGQMDANYGLLLQGDGTGAFKAIDQGSSGFQVKGDVRSLLQINEKIIFGICKGSLLTYELNSKASL